jgi:methylglyoxal synthase
MREQALNDLHAVRFLADGLSLAPHDPAIATSAIEALCTLCEVTTAGGSVGRQTTHAQANNHAKHSGTHSHAPTQARTGSHSSRPAR